MPDLLNTTFDQETPSIPPGFDIFAQYLVDVTRQLLGGERVLLLAIGPDKRISYVSTSGLTPEQKLRRSEMNGLFSLAEILQQKCNSTFLSERI